MVVRPYIGVLHLHDIKTMNDKENKLERSREEPNSPKPFKKAKYAWQIKGSARLQQTSTLHDQPCSSTRTHFEIEESSSEEESVLTPNIKDQIVIKTEVHNHSEAITKPRASVSFLSGNLNDPECRVANSTHNDGSVSPAHCMVVQCMEQFLSTLNRTNYILRKWQTKQIAKGIIDNAINKVLEEMGFSPVVNDVTYQNSQNDVIQQNIENEGVSEAIRQQGLQRSYHQQAAWLSSDEHQHDHQHDTRNPCTCWLYWKDGNEHTATTALAPAVQPDTAKSGTDDSNCRMIDTDCSDAIKMEDDYTEEEGEETPEQHDDLLDAAVSFAISSKGLNIFSNQA